MKDIKLKTRVNVEINNQDFGYGTVVSVNDFREPSVRYAVDLDITKNGDVIFCSRENLTVLKDVRN